MDASCISTRQIVHEPVDGHISVGESGLKSSSHMRSLAYASWLSAGDKSININISGGHTFDSRWVSSLNFTGWHKWRSGRKWRRFWCGLFESLWWRCTCAFSPPACLGILCCARLSRKPAARVIFPKHSRVSFPRSLHLFVPRDLHSPPLLFSDFGPTFPNQVLRFLYCGAQKPSFGHPGHTQGKAHVRLFKLYPTSLPCHSCRHVEKLHEISCCIYISDSAITSTKYPSLASSRVVKACFVHSQGCSLLNSPATFPVLTTSWRSIAQTVRTNALVDHGGFP